MLQGYTQARGEMVRRHAALVSPALDVLVLLHYNTHIICTIGVKVAQVYLKYANPNITMLRKQEHLSWFGSS